MGSQESCCSCNRQIIDKPIEKRIEESRRKQHGNYKSSTKYQSLAQVNTDGPKRVNTQTQPIEPTSEGIITLAETGDTATFTSKPYNNNNNNKPYWMANFPTAAKFYLKLSIFITVLPKKSKIHIWEHSVNVKLNGKKKTVLNETRDNKQVKRLLSDVIIVYLKYLNREKKQLQRRDVDPHIRPITMYIYNEFKPLQRDRFENERSYLSLMIQDYVQHNHSNVQ